MLKSLEIWNFESHEHTIFNDFSSGFNLICGQSDAGKTSAIRAIKLVAYNDFSQEMVRVGSKFCEVRLTTERGYVHCKRGKNINEWDVAENGKAIKHFESAGRGILDEVASVVGLNVIRLGEIELKVNVMHQLEGHFMMSALDGNKSTGSLRAQIIDEISGISGIEQLIKDVSLDNTRFNKEIKSLDEANNELKLKLHDENVLTTESNDLEAAEELLQTYAENKAYAEELQQVYVDFFTLTNSIVELQSQLKSLISEEEISSITSHLFKWENNTFQSQNGRKFYSDFAALYRNKEALKKQKAELPETSELETEINTVAEKASSLKDLCSLENSISNLNALVAMQYSNLNSLPDTVEPEALISEVRDNLNKTRDLQGYEHGWLGFLESIEENEERLKKLPETQVAEKIVVALELNLQKVTALKQKHYESSILSKDIGQSQKQLKSMDEEYQQYEKENADILSEFETCPFCQQDIIKGEDDEGITGEVHCCGSGEREA